MTSAQLMDFLTPTPPSLHFHAPSLTKLAASAFGVTPSPLSVHVQASYVHDDIFKIDRWRSSFSYSLVENVFSID